MGRSALLLAALALPACGDPCAPREGCVSSHQETRYRNGKCLRSHKEQQYHRGLVWHLLKPHWRIELKADDDLTEVCDEYEQVAYTVDVCDERGPLHDSSGAVVPEDAAGCAEQKAPR